MSDQMHRCGQIHISEQRLIEMSGAEAKLAAQTARADAAEARERELVAALENTARELQAWHDERPCSPAMKVVCVTCGYLEDAGDLLAASPGSHPQQP